MNRRSFLALFGGGSVALAIPPRAALPLAPTDCWRGVLRVSVYGGAAIGDESLLGSYDVPARGCSEPTGTCYEIPEGIELILQGPIAVSRVTSALPPNLQFIRRTVDLPMTPGRADKGNIVRILLPSTILIIS